MMLRMLWEWIIKAGQYLSTVIFPQRAFMPLRCWIRLREVPALPWTINCMKSWSVCVSLVLMIVRMLWMMVLMEKWPKFMRLSALPICVICRLPWLIVKKSICCIKRYFLNVLNWSFSVSMRLVTIVIFQWYFLRKQRFSLLRRSWMLKAFIQDAISILQWIPLHRYFLM